MFITYQAIAYMFGSSVCPKLYGIIRFRCAGKSLTEITVDMKGIEADHEDFVYSFSIDGVLPRDKYRKMHLIHSEDIIHCIIYLKNINVEDIFDRNIQIYRESMSGIRDSISRGIIRKIIEGKKNYSAL